MAVPPADSPLWNEVLRTLSARPDLLLLPVAPSPFDRLMAEALDRRLIRPDELTPAGLARAKRVPR